MKLSAILAPLIAAKVPYEVILQTVVAYEAAQADALEKRRQSDRERQAKSRSMSRESRDPSTKSRDRFLVRDRVARVEDKTLTTDIEPQKKQTSSDVAAFKAAFAGVCDPERVEAIIKHRRTKRGQITGHAANLFIADAKAAGLSVPDAVDTCISRNWITVKADWLKPDQRGSPPPRPRSPVDVANELLRKMETASADPSEKIEGYPAAPLRLSDYRHG